MDTIIVFQQYKFELTIQLITFIYPLRRKNLKYFIHQNLMLSMLCQILTYKIPLWIVKDLPSKSSVRILLYCSKFCHGIISDLLIN